MSAISEPLRDRSGIERSGWFRFDQVELQRFERDDTGPVILSGTIAIEAAGRPRRFDRIDIWVPVAGSTMADRVAAMSTALAEASDTIANRIVP